MFSVKTSWVHVLVMGVCFNVLQALAQPIIDSDSWLIGVNTMEVSYGFNQSNLSLLRGVVIDTKLEPSVDFKAETDRGFISLQNGIGFWINHSPSLKSGVSLNYMLGRYQGTDLHYQGLGDRSGSFDAYAFAEWQPILEAVTLYTNVASTPAPIQREFAQVGVTLGVPLVSQWNAFLDLNETWGNAVYWQTYYAVNPLQQASSAKSQFNPSLGGVLYQSKTLGGVYSFSSSVDLIMGLGVLEASPSLMQSPLMGSKRQHTAMFMINQKLISH
jgi:outer membrane scaffolding protein for murein synthesis (MipA/OmpV family)